MVFGFFTWPRTAHQLYRWKLARASSVTGLENLPSVTINIENSACCKQLVCVGSVCPNGHR